MADNDQKSKQQTPGRMPRGVPMKNMVKNPGKVLGRLMGMVMKRYWFAYAIVLACIVVSVLANVRGTMFTKTLIDDYIRPLMGQPSPDFGPLAAAIGRVAVFYMIGILAAFAQNRIMILVSQGFLRDIRIDLFDRMEKLPLRYFDSTTHGDIMSVYTNDIDTLRQMVSQSLPQMVNSAITLVSVLVSMISLSLPLTGVVLVMSVLIFIVSRKIASQSGKYFMEQQKNLGDLNGFVEERISGQKVVKVFCHEEKSIEEFREKSGKLFESARRANTFVNFMGPINAQLGNLMYVVTAIAGGYLALGGIGGFTVGSLVSFLTFTKSFNGPINQVTSQMNSIIMALAGAERIFAMMDEKPETDEGTVTLVNAKREADGSVTETDARTGIWAWKKETEEGVKYRELAGDVRFADVDFGYVPEKTVLHDINLFAKPGQKIAFVGSTGAGKTTITNLINRFYDIQEGEILYDGIPVADIKKNDLRRSLGIVLQDTHLFTGTVAENIRFGKLDATDEEVRAAAKLAGADGFIRRLPEGYDTMLKGDGSNLSQGQRQLLAIARAAVADPPVLILDEATSSIDTRTERIVQEGMDHLMAGRTTFVIAHRLSTVRNADCIMVLEQGRIIERGTHDELLEEKGRYYQLYTGLSA